MYISLPARVLEARQIICLAEKYNVDIICSIMSDKIYTDLMSDATRINKIYYFTTKLKKYRNKSKFFSIKKFKNLQRKDLSI